MNNLIDERDERTRKRKKFKRKMDSIIGLSTNDDGKPVLKLNVSEAKLSDKTIRLLDEGYIDNGFVIKKGTIEKFLNGKNEKVRGYARNDEGDWERTDVLNLTDDFVGTVNLGHMDFATFPYIIGEWTREDLSIVDIDNDRKALDVKVHLDEDSMFVKELRRQPYDIGVSAEFYYNLNEDDTMALSEMLGYYMPVLDEIFINAYGLVGECGNVNSSGLELKGDNDMSKENMDIMAEENIELEAENVEAESDEILEPDTDTEGPEAQEELSADGDGDAEDEVNEEQLDAESEESEEDEPDETDLAVSEEGDIDEADLDEVLTVVEELKSQVASLTEKIESLEEANCELKKTNKRLSGKLKDEKKKKEAFIQSAKSISVKLGVNEEKPKNNETSMQSFAFGDGIGD